MHTHSRSLSEATFSLDVQLKHRKLLDIVENATRLVERGDGLSVMVDPRAAIAAIAESNRMDGEYEIDNRQKQAPFFLNINLAGRPA
jgi:hypothetical protein